MGYLRDSRSWEPLEIQLISYSEVKNFFGREPTWEELDTLAREGIFLSRHSHLYWEIKGTFKEEN